MNRKPDALRRSTPWVLIAVLLSAPLATFVPSTTEAQVSGCLQDARDFPLFITNVAFKLISGAEDSIVTADGAVFVEGGDRLEVTLTVINRVIAACAQLPREQTNNVRARVTYPLAADLYDVAMQGRCPALANAASSCSSFRTTFTVEDGHPGEHRVRFVVGNQAGADYDRMAGAERVLVVDQKPDLVLRNMAWALPAAPGDRRSTYSSSGASTFDLTIANEGTYPNWNPNGARLDSAGNPFFAYRSSFDAPGDGDEAPDQRGRASENEYDLAETTAAAPRCVEDRATDVQTMDENEWWTDDPNDATTNDKVMVCSYMRGQPLQMPIRYDVLRSGSSTPELTGVNLARAAPFLGDPQRDEDAILHPNNEDGAPNTLVQSLLIDKHRLNRAGDYDLKVTLDKDAAGKSFTPEVNEDNNDRTEQTRILGVDLQLRNPEVAVQGAGGVAGCGLSEDPDAANGPCPSGSLISINAAYVNAGDSEVDNVNELTERWWKAAVYIRRGGSGNFTIATDDAGDEATVRFDRVKRTTEGGTKLWASPLKIPSASDGGVHELLIRLDHVANYAGQTPPVPNFGRIIEKQETFATCDAPVPPSDLDNGFCIKLFFDDSTFPEITNMRIADQLKGADVPAFNEGSNITFEATVTDNSLDVVEAVITDAEGNTTNHTMARKSPGSDVFTVKVPFEGMLGRHLYQVRANDTFGHVTLTEEGFEFDIVEWPKQIAIRTLRVNGQTDFISNAPTYRGTASAPANTWHIEADVTKDGRADVFDPAGKNATIFTPDDKLNASLPMDFYLICDLVNEVNGDRSTGFRSDCAGEEGERAVTSQGPRIVENKRARWFATNTNCSQGDFASEHCTTWQKFKLGWVGEFDLNVTVTDPYGRNNSVGRLAQLTDIDGPPTVTDASLAPASVNAGQKVTARAKATDGLRVEDVVLRITKPDTTSEDLAMKLDGTPDDAETRNGTYKGVFDTGVFKDFDQAGRYKVEIVAIDFAGKETAVSVGDNGNFRLNDTTNPVLTAVFTVPAEAQEENGPVTWELSVQDETQVKPPKLTLTRPASGTETFTFVYNEDTKRWNFSLTADPADVGTWTYTIEVEDYAGNLASAQGTIRIATNLPPQATNWKPNIVGQDGEVYGPARPTIQVDLVDFGSGVDQASIKMTVDGQTVSPQLSPIQNGFRLSYTVPAANAFKDGDVVTVKVSAKDNTDPTQLEAKDLAYQFIVDAVAPTATFDASPSLVRGGQRVVGLVTDINVTATDAGSGPGKSSVTVHHLAGNTATAQESFEIDGAESFRLDELTKAFQGHGTYRITITPTDAVGNVGNQVQHTVLYDKSAPKVRVFAQPGQPREVVFANITDDSKVESALVKYKADGSEEASLALEQNDDGDWTGEIPAFPKNTTVEFVVEAKDFFGNVGSSPPDSFRAGDAVPTITITDPTEGQTISGVHEVTWTASDLETKASELKVSLYYKRPNEEFRAIAEGQSLTNVGRYNLDTTGLPNGDVILQAIVFDGTNFGDHKVTVRVQNLNRIFSDPRIEGITATDGKHIVGPGQELVFSVQVDGQASKLWANVTKAGQAVLSIPLDATGQGAWKGSFTAPTEAGDYFVSLAALTPDGPVQTDDAFGFTVQSADGNGKSFVSEWVILSVLFAGALAVGIVGLAQRWK